VIQSVDRAVRILKALASGPGRLGVSELSQRLGLAKGTVHGLLRTLQEHGLVEQHPDSDKYQLGGQLLQLSNRFLDLNELRSRSLAWSELLATRANEAVRVGALHGESMLIVHHVFRPDSSLQILEVGEVLPLHATAALRRELAATRERGFAVEREEAILGEAGVAAPIFDRRAEPIGAVGVAGPRERLLRRGRDRTVAAAVVEAARGISRDLGAPRWPAA
jgi:DNA-binding IclR family transcriptional regulator